VKAGYLSEIFVSFQGEGAHVGRRHLFVRLAGCNMRCSYCDTPDSLERTAAYWIHRAGGPPERGENPVPAADLRRLIAPLLAHDGPIEAVAVTGGEPLTQAEFVAAFLNAERLPVPVLLETNGVLPQRLRVVLPVVDIISMDIKLPSNTHEGPYWAEHAEFLDLARTKDLYVKILVDQSTTDADVEQAATMVARIEPMIPTFLQPIVDPLGHALIEGGRLTRLYTLARRHLPSVRVLPQTHKLLGIQ
jgi:7-carboxy-7-deazaguanine synthase